MGRGNKQDTGKIEAIGWLFVCIYVCCFVPWTRRVSFRVGAPSASELWSKIDLMNDYLYPRKTTSIFSSVPLSLPSFLSY